MVKELVKFFTTFGLPRVVQTDQGTNFTSKIFAQVLHELGIKHQTSSAYHPESQGCLERFHQTLKSMIRAYCVQTGKDWAEGLPFLVFAARDSVQESLGFSPAELVFGHTVRGPLKLLHEQLLAKEMSNIPLLDYVSAFRERLHIAGEVARAHLATTQSKLKHRYDKRSVKRDFQVGESVLALLPVPSSVFSAKFSGPYVVERKISETDYIIQTPDRRRKTRVCHINMLKRYLKSEAKPALPTLLVSTSVDLENCVEVEIEPEDVISSSRLQNSEILKSLPSFLNHLSGKEYTDVCALIQLFPSLFKDVPGRTSVLQHDVDVGDAHPIKQHPYHVNPYKREVMKAEVEYLLQNGLAVPSQSPWSSPCLLVPKPDSTHRFCTDYVVLIALQGLTPFLSLA